MRLVGEGTREGGRGESRPGPPPGPRGVGSAPPRPAALRPAGGGSRRRRRRRRRRLCRAPVRADPEAAARLWSAAPGPGPTGCSPRSRTGMCGSPRRRCWTPARTRSPASSICASSSRMQSQLISNSFLIYISHIYIMCSLKTL